MLMSCDYFSSDDRTYASLCNKKLYHPTNGLASYKIDTSVLLNIITWRTYTTYEKLHPEAYLAQSYYSDSSS